jgi:hypothetical protein
MYVFCARAYKTLLCQEWRRKNSEVTNFVCINLQMNRHVPVAATTIIKEDNTSAPKTPLLEGACLVMDTSLYFASCNTRPLSV